MESKYESTDLETNPNPLPICGTAATKLALGPRDERNDVAKTAACRSSGPAWQTNTHEMLLFFDANVGIVKTSFNTRPLRSTHDRVLNRSLGEFGYRDFR